MIHRPAKAHGTAACMPHPITAEGRDRVLRSGRPHSKPSRPAHGTRRCNGALEGPELTSEYPQLAEEDIRAALRYAAESSRTSLLFPLAG